MDLDRLLAAIHENPDDLASRLVYGDLMLERGDPLGELIHVDCAISALPIYDPARRALVRRRTEIFDAHLRDGFVEWWQWDGKFPRFCNGFIEGIHFSGSAGAGSIDNLDDQLVAMYDRWRDRPCRCGATHDPLMWVTPEQTFPLIRRFGGLAFGNFAAFAEDLAARGALELRVIGNGDWRSLAGFDAVESMTITDSDTTARFEYVLALPRLTELALGRSPELVRRLAAIGIPPTLRRISVEPMHAQPLRDALAASGRAVVENEKPTAGELVLVTDVKRAHDLAFLDRPILTADPIEPHPIPAAESPWPRRGTIEMTLDHPQLAFATRGTPTVVAGGIRVASCGPVYVRLENLVENRPVHVSWKINRVARWIQVYAGAESIEAPLPLARRNLDWTFVIPGAVVRDAWLQLVIAGYKGEPFTLYRLRYFQPD